MAGGSCLNIPNEGGLLKTRKYMDSEGNASKFGGPIRDMYLPVQCSTVELDLSSSKCENGQPNCSKSPTTVLSSNTSVANLCLPDGYFSPQLQFLPCSSDGNFWEPSKFRALKRGQRAAPDNEYGFSHDGIHNSCDGFSREDSTGASPSCSDSGNLELLFWGMQEDINILRALGASEATLSYMEKPKRGHSMIYNGSFEIQKENSESFAAVHILADTAVWVLENHRAKASSAQWGLFHPTGVPFRQKRVIRRAKNSFKALSQLQSNADKKVAANSELLSGSLEFIQPSENQGATQSVRCSKRTRSQFLNSKYCDSILY